MNIYGFLVKREKEDTIIKSKDDSIRRIAYPNPSWCPGDKTEEYFFCPPSLFINICISTWVTRSNHKAETQLLMN